MTYRNTAGSEPPANSTETRPVEPPSTRIAYRLAEEVGVAVEELRPLAESVDPEALDSIFDQRGAENAYVTFRHEDHTITVTGSGDVLVDPVDAE